MEKQKSHYSKKITALTSIIFLFLSVVPSLSQTIIEGLYYLDNSPVSIEINNGKIAKIKRLKKLSDENNNVYIAPGLFDNQVNGFAGVSFSFAGGDLSVDGIKKATEALWKEGVTTYLPTLTTNSQEILIKNLSILAKAKDNEDIYGSIPGFHIEGPYINPNDGFRGAHPKKYVRKADWSEFMELYNASDNSILTITVAPEIEGAQDFIRKSTEMGIVVALGHHNASTDIINQAVANGAKISTHLGNGCANMINRHANPIWPQLSNDQLYASIICDGFHLLPEEINVFYKTKGIEKTIITSDVTSYAALPPGRYETIHGDTIELTPEGLLHYPAQNVLYGSASAISKGVPHIMKVTGCTLADAIRMASTNPANLYNLNDRGTLEPGKRADIILFTLDGEKLNVMKTYVNGNLVYDKKK